MNSVFRTWKFWVQFSGLKFWGRHSEKIKEKIKKVSKFRICPKTFPSVRTCFGAIFLKTFFCPVFHGVIESFRKNQRKFKFAEMPRIVPKIVQTCFEHVLWNFFRKKIAPCSMEGRVFEKLQKKSKNFQNSKSVQSRCQKCPNAFWTCFGAVFPIFVCPVFHAGLFRFSGVKKMRSVFWT